MRRLGRLSLTMIACLTVGAALQAQQGPPAGEAETPTAPVTLDGVTLFHVRGVSSLPADQRAQRIEERLRAVAADDTIAPETLRMVESEDAIRIFAGDTLIMGVVDPDASLELVRRAKRLQVGVLHQIFRVGRPPCQSQSGAVEAVDIRQGLLRERVVGAGRRLPRRRRASSEDHQFIGRSVDP